ncbi:hypothetical protein JI435_037070, partial [Parastagonospora nodorum SN15]
HPKLPTPYIAPLVSTHSLFVAQTINCLPPPCKLYCRTLRYGPSAPIHGNQTKCLITAENFGEPAHLKADKPRSALIFHVDARSRSSVTISDSLLPATTLIRPR